MKLGIKYCGGCNSHYDRVAAVQRIIQKFPSCSITYHPETEGCDVCLLVSGCPISCVAPPTITVPIYTACTAQQISDFATILQQRITNTDHPET